LATSTTLQQPTSVPLFYRIEFKNNLCHGILDLSSDRLSQELRDSIWYCIVDSIGPRTIKLSIDPHIKRKMFFDFTNDILWFPARRPVASAVNAVGEQERLLL
jgi:hypothetical protein